MGLDREEGDNRHRHDAYGDGQNLEGDPQRLVGPAQAKVGEDQPALVVQMLHLDVEHPALLGEERPRLAGRAAAGLALGLVKGERFGQAVGDPSRQIASNVFAFFPVREIDHDDRLSAHAAIARSAMAIRRAPRP